MNSDCPFCNLDLAEARIIHSFVHWNLFLQSEEKRQKTKWAAGFLATTNHIETPTQVSDDAWAELKRIIPEVSERLCTASDSTYLGSETVGFNQGLLAGQTVTHAHVHVLPSVQEDPVELQVRGGIGGAFEALRQVRVKS